MTAAWMWLRTDLRVRWRSWVVLGLLMGVSAGLAAAGVAGARRTERAIPAYARAMHLTDAALLANDPNYDAAKRAEVARLPEVTQTYPFMVPFLLAETSHPGFEVPLLPVATRSMLVMTEPIVEGRLPRPDRPDEIVVNEPARERFRLRIGSTLRFQQERPRIAQTMRVVGITRSTSDEVDSMPSSAFYAKYEPQLRQAGIVNEFVDLRRGEADLARFRTHVDTILGHPVNVESVAEVFGVRKARSMSNVERAGLLLFALTVVLGAGALVGQALVRAVSAGASDLPIYRALGADRAIAVTAMLAPAAVTAVAGAVSALVVAIALSPRFPIASTRRYDLDIGFHADWLVLSLTALAVVVTVLAAAWVTAELRVRRADRSPTHPPLASRLATLDLPPAMSIGSRLATDAGRGRRAVPVRSALVGAVVGVLGCVGCLTFRQGLADTVKDPARSGVVWDHVFAAAGEVPQGDRARVTRQPAVDAVLDAAWARTVKVNGVSTPTWATEPLKGRFGLVVTAGRAPRTSREIAMAPRTLTDLRVHLGDVVRVGPGRGRAMRVVGVALVPSSSHTDYDLSAWITSSTLPRVVSRADLANPEFIEDYLLIRWRPGADRAPAKQAFDAMVEEAASRDALYVSEPARLPVAVASLRQLRSLPFALAIFFALLASATVAHALVTTVRRRAQDLAILRSIGFTRGNARLAIAWQSTMLAIVGLVLGVPLGILVGRGVWKQLADTFPVVYVPPLALVGVLLVLPVAIAIANLLAAGPAHAATRVRPAEALRTE